MSSVSVQGPINIENTFKLIRTLETETRRGLRYLVTNKDFDSFEMFNVKMALRKKLRNIYSEINRNGCVAQKAGILRGNLKEQLEQAIEDVDSLEADLRCLSTRVAIVLKQQLGDSQDSAAAKTASVVQVRIDERHLLPQALFERAKPYLAEPAKLKDMPRAAQGTTPVYFPKDLPVVLKHSGASELQSITEIGPRPNPCVKRLEKMQQAREICEANHYVDLSIPAARVHGEFIVESRLPINGNSKFQMGLYLEHRDLFTKPIGEFTGFRCQSRMTDLIAPCGTPRYDNVPLYIERANDGPRGKLGLIDLEHFTPKLPLQIQTEWCFDICKDLVAFFPLHVDEIIEAAKKFDPNIESFRQELEKVRDKALKDMNELYGVHLDFIRKKGIVIEKPMQLAPIDAKQSDQITKEVMERMSNDLKNEKDKQAFKKLFPNVQKLMVTFLSDALHRELQKRGGKDAISSYMQLPYHRTLKLDHSKDPFFEELFKQVIAEFGKHSLAIDKLDEHYATWIVQCTLTAFVNAGVIAEYRPDFQLYDISC